MQVDPSRRVKIRLVCLHNFIVIAFGILGWHNPGSEGGLIPLKETSASIYVGLDTKHCLTY